MIEGILIGLQTALSLKNILMVMMGCFFGTIIGMLPGLGPMTAIALMIPITYGFEPATGLILMAGVYYGAVFGGSTSSILINAPGAPPAVATALDGYPMAKNGEPGRALGLAAVSSVFGGIFSLIIFIFAAPLLAKLALEFGPAEYFGLAVFALSMLASMSGKSSLRNLISGLVGVLIGTIGIHLTTGVERFTFDIPDLEEGIHFVPVLIGLFAVSELFKQSEKLNAVVERIQAKALRLPTLFELKKLKYTILRSSGIGTFIGILPAEGSTVAAIIGYNEARRWSKDKDNFGKGSPEGIVGPEAANNAAAGGAMVPTLALGIPGSGSTALILAALIMHGFRPGPYLISETPEFVYAIFGAMLIANLGFLFIGLVGAKFFSLVAFIPKKLLWPAVFIFSMIGSYSFASSMFDVWVMLAAGLVGYFMDRHGFSAAPLVMGLILGKLVEESFSQSMIIHDNNFFALLESPVVLLFFVLTFLSLSSPFWTRYFSKK